ncbi:MAG: ATP synthase F1 subunit gamma [Lachnospiraceae bacterium]|nr:ATP synthase F1 subunit gamma [Lachnospiraceae bacterium]
MAQLSEIKDRIESIEGTQKITNAMYMIATTKLRHAKENRDKNAVYFNALKNLVERLLRHAPVSESIYLNSSTKPVEEQTHGYLVVTADKGLAGAYNQNVQKETERLMREKGGESRLFVVGVTGRRYFEHHNVPMEPEFNYSAEEPTHHVGRMISGWILPLFMNGEIDDLTIIFTAMKSAMEVEVRSRQILPLVHTLDKTDMLLSSAHRPVSNEEFLFTPSFEEVINAVVPNYMNGYIYSALIESYCSEQNSRMLAMQTASEAAVSITRDLTRQYNRERQKAITQEITEVSAGAEALNS